MYTVEVDFDVYKAIFSLRAKETVSENDVLRNLLKLGPPSESSAVMPKVNDAPINAPEDWLPKGVRFPLGTDFRATYKGKTYTGRVQAGALLVDGKRYASPSSAAVAITGSAVNGWRFWEARLPGKSSWQLIETLRR